MDALSRRALLRTAGRGVGTALAGGAAVAAAASGAQAAAERQAPADAVGMLYDATKCIGCKACVAECAKVNDLAPDTERSGGLWQMPTDLNTQTKNIIKLYADPDTGATSFVKRQCMHCIDPACVSGCPFNALQKGAKGIVAWDGTRCIGCRYCEVACPFEIPKFEWSSNSPKIVKCELCRERLAEGKLPGCVEVCPRKAVIYGARAELLEEAHRRIKDQPQRYQPKVYGEHDGGGTQVIYLSALPYDKLGLPELGDAAPPQLSETIQHGIYRGFIAPVVLYGALGAVILRNRRNPETPDAGSDGDEGGSR